jgi:hypothetical protein
VPTPVREKCLDTLLTNRAVFPAVVEIDRSSPLAFEKAAVAEDVAVRVRPTDRTRARTAVDVRANVFAGLRRKAVLLDAVADSVLAVGAEPPNRSSRLMGLPINGCSREWLKRYRGKRCSCCILPCRTRSGRHGHGRRTPIHIRFCACEFPPPNIRADRHGGGINRSAYGHVHLGKVRRHPIRADNAKPAKELLISVAKQIEWAKA